VNPTDDILFVPVGSEQVAVAHLAAHVQSPRRGSTCAATTPTSRVIDGELCPIYGVDPTFARGGGVIG